MAQSPQPATYSAKMRADDRRGDRVGLEAVEPLAVRGLARVRVRPGVGQPVAVGRAAAEEPALVLSLLPPSRCGPGS